MSSLPAGWLRPGPVNGQKTLNSTASYCNHCCGNSDNLPDTASGYSSSHFRSSAENRSAGSAEDPARFRSNRTVNRCTTGRLKCCCCCCACGESTGKHRGRDYDCHNSNLDLSIHECWSCPACSEFSRVQESHSCRWSREPPVARPFIAAVRAGHEWDDRSAQQHSISTDQC